VDNPAVLRGLAPILRRSARFQEFGLWNQVEEIAHLQYSLHRVTSSSLKNARVVMTDSDGLQEEATHPRIKKPVLVLRSSTERPEAVIHGFARVVGINPVVVLAELEKVLNEEPKLPDQSPFGDGKAGARIVDIVLSRLEA